MIGPDDAADSKVAGRDLGCGQDDVGALDGGKLFEDRLRAVSQPGLLLPLLERLPEDIGEEANQDVTFHAAGLLVPDGPDGQIALLDPEGRLGLRELNVGAPEVFRFPVQDVGSQDVAALADARPLVPFRP